MSKLVYHSNEEYNSGRVNLSISNDFFLRLKEYVIEHNLDEVPFTIRFKDGYELDLFADRKALLGEYDA